MLSALIGTALVAGPKSALPAYAPMCFAVAHGVNDHGVDADRILVWILERRGVGARRWIENYDVSEIAMLQRAALGEFQLVRC